MAAAERGLMGSTHAKCVLTGIVCQCAVPCAQAATAGQGGHVGAECTQPGRGQ